MMIWWGVSNGIFFKKFIHDRGMIGWDDQHMSGIGQNHQVIESSGMRNGGIVGIYRLVMTVTVRDIESCP